VDLHGTAGKTQAGERWAEAGAGAVVAEAEASDAVLSMERLFSLGPVLKEAVASMLAVGQQERPQKPLAVIAQFLHDVRPAPWSQQGQQGQQQRQAAPPPREAMVAAAAAAAVIAGPNLPEGVPPARQAPSVPTNS
jgi:hypothetical protein